MLVEVAGVDSKCIGKLDIRNHYTFIFQSLSEAEIQSQRLNIKRIKYHRRNNKKYHSMPKAIYTNLDSLVQGFVATQLRI